MPGALEDPGNCPTSTRGATVCPLGATDVAAWAATGATAPGPSTAGAVLVSGKCPLGATAPDPAAAAGCSTVAFATAGWETCVGFSGGRTTSIDEDSVEVLDGSVVGPTDGDEPNDPTAGTPKWAVPSVLALLECSVIAVAAVIAAEGNGVYG